MNSNRWASRLCFGFACIVGLLFCLTGRSQPAPEHPSTGNFFGALLENDTNTVFRLLDADTNLVRASYAGRLPLHIAAQKGFTPIVAKLLKAGADIDEENDSLDTGNCHLTALDIAVWYYQPEVCRLLLESGANSNLIGYHEGTALRLAFLYNRTEMAGWLLDHGANPFLKNDSTYYDPTPMDAALAHGYGNLVPRMLETLPRFTASQIRTNVPRSREPFNHWPPKDAKAIFAERSGNWLLAAAQHGEYEAVKALFRAGATISDPTPDCLTLMQAFAVATAAAERGLPGTQSQLQAVQAELKRDYIPNAEARFVAERRAQAEVLSRAVQTSAPQLRGKILNLLIQHGADYDALAATALNDTNQITRLLVARNNVTQSRDFAGNTPLHWAVNTDRPQMLAFWIYAGAPLAATNSAGQTALHLAAANGKTEFIKALLSAHAPTDLRDTNGWTPLDAAIQAKQTDSIHLLLGDKSAPVHPERGLAGSLHDAAAAGNIAALASLLETETNLEVRNELGLTPLQVAGQAGQLGAAAFLIDQGADVNARDPDGNTVLHQILLSRTHWVKGRPSDAWVERRKKNPSQEKFWRVYNTPSGYTSPRELAASVAFFLACGADTAATNHAGQTILQLVTADSTMLWDYDRAAILPLLQQSGNGLNERDADGNTALHRLSTGFYDGNKVDNMVSLIARGANVNATNNLGQTPLHVASEKITMWDNNDPPINNPFQFLIYKKADVNARDNEGRTPMDVVAASGSSFKSEAMALLIKAGAKSNATDKKGLTPVHQALTGAWPWESAGENLQQLAKAGADFSAKDNNGKTPLHYLAALGDQRPLFFIRGVDQIFINAKVDFNARDNDGNTPLHIAAKTGTRDVFDWLVKQGAGLDETNNAGETPRLLSAHASNSFSRFGPPDADTDIFVAAREGKLESLSALIKADPKLVNATNQFNQTPLRIAVMARRTNVVAFLEQHGANWDEASAVMAGRADALQEILQRDPSAVTTTAQGRGLTHIAAANGDVEILKMLIAAKCDLQATDSWGLSPLGRALINKNKDVQELLLQHGARENFFDAVYAEDLPTVTALLAQDKTLASIRNSANNSALEIAAAAGYPDILKMLLKGTSFSSTSLGGGQNTIHLAAFFDRTNALTLLIHAGANVNQTDRLGFTPLHWAVTRGATGAAVILLKHKADANRPIAQIEQRTVGVRGTFGGDTPLHLAALCGQTNMVQLLLKSGADVNTVNGMQLTPLDLAECLRPMNPFGIGMLQSVMTRLLAPLDVNQPPVNPFGVNREGQKVAATLIEAAGGKHSQNQQPFHQWPGPQSSLH